MFYSSRYFWRLVIILILLALILPQLSEALNSLKSFINFIIAKFSSLINLIKQKS